MAAKHHITRLLSVGCVLLLTLALGLTSCGEDEPAPASRASGTQRRARSEPGQGSDVAGNSAGAADPQPIDPATTGGLRGVAFFQGEAPVRKSIDTSSVGGCHSEGGVLTEQAIVNDGRVQNVFVRVKGGLEGWIMPPAPTEPARLDQEGCVYVPHVLGVRVGQPLHVDNSDQATHNVNARPKRRQNEAFNRIQPPNGAAITATFSEEEVAVRFECNLHPWMNAWVAAVDHPFFAVSGPDGAFAIEGLPPGEYDLEAWHERFGRSAARVTVLAGSTAEVAFTFSD